MRSATELGVRLMQELAEALDAPVRDIVSDGPGEPGDLDRSGVAALTGPANGPPLPVPGRPASTTRAALAVASAYLQADLPGVEVLGERAGMLGLTRNAPWSAGGAFRAVQTINGWFGLSLSRAADLDLLAALTKAPVADPWTAVTVWARSRMTAEVAERVTLLGLPGAAIPHRPLPERRPPVLVTRGGYRRRRREPPLVVDLTALWAGPLCARLLGLSGAEIVKIESIDRPDGARIGSPEFFSHLHDGHELAVLDFALDRERLARMISTADVVLEGSRPRALRQLGIDAVDHVARGAIWVSITAYGRGAQDEQRVGFGDDVAAGAGLVADLHGVPVSVGDAIADPLAGVHAAAAAAVALAGDRGALLDVSMHDTARRAVQP